MPGKTFQHDHFRARVHQPHSDRVTPEAKERKMTQAEDAAVAPDDVHGDGDQAQAQCLAEGLYKARRQKRDACGFGQQRHAKGEASEGQKEPQHRGVLGDERVLHVLIRRSPTFLGDDALGSELNEEDDEKDHIGLRRKRI